MLSFFFGGSFPGACRRVARERSAKQETGAGGATSLSSRSSRLLLARKTTSFNWACLIGWSIFTGTHFFSLEENPPGTPKRSPAGQKKEVSWEPPVRQKQDKNPKIDARGALQKVPNPCGDVPFSLPPLVSFSFCFSSPSFL